MNPTLINDPPHPENQSYEDTRLVGIVFHCINKYLFSYSILRRKPILTFVKTGFLQLLEPEDIEAPRQVGPKQIKTRKKTFVTLSFLLSYIRLNPYV